MTIKDDKIFIYLRLRDDKETLLKSKIREFAGIGRLLIEFMKEIIGRFGLQAMKMGTIEYVDSNTDLVLISFKKDLIRQKVILSGVIPHKYQSRMLNKEETRLQAPVKDFIEQISPKLDSFSKAIIHQRLQKQPYDIISIIKESINENGEFYVLLDSQ